MPAPAVPVATGSVGALVGLVLALSLHVANFLTGLLQEPSGMAIPATSPSPTPWTCHIDSG